jgi:small subunit ribosomal protein S8
MVTPDAQWLEVTRVSHNLGKIHDVDVASFELKYFEGAPAIQHVARVSKPGRRVYSGSQELPVIRNGLGITIVSTPKGVLSDAEARAQNVGGEILAEVF